MRELLRRGWYFIRRRQLAADLAEEIEFHRAMKERDLEAQGLAPAAARDHARRALGNDLAARERAADVWLAPWLQDLTQDIRFAARLLLKDRGFAVVAVTALGLGIGVNNTLFSILNAFCIRGLPIDSPERVVYVQSRDVAGRNRPVSFLDFEDLRSSVKTVRDFAAFAAVPVALRDDRAAERYQGAHISASAFGLIGEAPILGRDFRPDDDRVSAPLVIVIAGGVWKSRYGSDPQIIGRPIVINGAPGTIIGVMRDGFGFPNNVEVWLPLAQMKGLTDQPRDAQTLGVFGRLNDQAELSEARAEIDALGRRLAADHRATNEGIRLTSLPINERFMGRLTDPAWLAFITAGGLVVIIACANVANLLLSRSVVRAREIAIRASLGATRRRVVRQLLVESALLALGGGILGVALSFIGLELMMRAIPAAVRSYWLDFSMDGRVFTVLVGVCLGTVFVSGLVPALQVSNTNPAEVMRDGGRGATSGSRARRWTAAFLTAEFALTLLLLSVVGEAIAGFFERQRVDRVIDPAPLLTMMLSLPAEKYPSPPQRAVFYDALVERLSGIDAISAAAVATSLPTGGAPSRDVAIDGRPAAERTPLSVNVVLIGDAYFQTMALGLLSGRAFTSRDGTPGYEAAIVNQRFVDVHFAGQDPLGRRIRLTTGSRAQNAPWLTIVGVSPTVRQRPQLEPDPVVYLPYRAEPPASVALIVRAPSNPSSVTPHLRDELRKLDPDLPLYRILPLEQAMYESAWNTRVSTWIITILATICVCLSVVGLYAVTAHSVAQRTQELGVRVALGARPPEIRWLVLRRAMWQLTVGIAVGVACTYAWSRLFGRASFVGPVGLSLVTLLLAAVAIVACLVPARRAARLDPVVALRAE